MVLYKHGLEATFTSLPACTCLSAGLCAYLHSACLSMSQYMPGCLLVMPVSGSLCVCLICVGSNFIEPDIEGLKMNFRISGFCLSSQLKVPSTTLWVWDGVGGASHSCFRAISQNNIGPGWVLSLTHLKLDATSFF